MRESVIARGAGVLLGIAAACGASLACAESHRVVATLLNAETREVRAGGTMSHFIVSDDGRHYARLKNAGSRFVVERDGVASQPWDEVGLLGDPDEASGRSYGYLMFDPSGTRLAYVARDGQRTVLVVNDQQTPIEPADLRHAGVLRFSPGGSRYAFLVRNASAGKAWLIVDGKTFGPYGEIKQLTFSADGRHVAFVGHRSPFAAQRAGVAVVLDGKESPLYFSVDSLLLSADGVHHAYQSVAQYKGDFPEGVRVVVDGKPGATRYQSVGSLQMSADGRKVVFIGVPTNDGPNASGGARVVTNGANGKEYTYVHHLVLSPDGSRVAYVPIVTAQNMSESRIAYVADGKESRDYPDNASGDVVFFSGDSKHVAFDAFTEVLVDGKEHPGAGMGQGPGIATGTKGSGFVYRTKEDDNVVRVFVNGAQGPDLTSANLQTLAFSPDESAAAYEAIDLKGVPVLVVGKQVFPLPTNSLSGFVFPTEQNRRILWSPDGRHFTFLSGTKAFLDGKPGPDCNRGILPTFSADSKHLAFACPEHATSGVGNGFGIYLDGQRVAGVDAVFKDQPGTWSFKTDGSLVLLALSGAEVQEITSGPATGLGSWAGAPSAKAGKTVPATTTADASQTGTSGTGEPTAAAKPGDDLEEKTRKARDKLRKKLGGLFN